MGVVYRASLLIDGTDRDPILNTGFEVEDGRFLRVGGASVRDGIPLDGVTVLPGLIDAHSHMGILSMRDHGSEPPAVLAAHMFRNAELALMGGHTTVRDVGGADGALRQAIDLDLIAGPRLLPSGPLICQTGGHGDLRKRYVEHHHTPGYPGLSQFSLPADGTEGVRRAVRVAFARGATQIKVVVSGGIVSHSDRLEDTQFSLDELRVAVEEARARDTYVTGHAFNLASIRLAIDAGLRCIEHGSFLDEETADRMAAEGVALVPTLTAIALIRDRAAEWGISANAFDRLALVDQANREAVRLAYAAGVDVGSGSDLIGVEQSVRGMEIGLKAELIGPMAAVVSATSVNARILGLGEVVGSIEAGKRADFIAVDGNPLDEPTLFRDLSRIVLVVKDGRVMKDDWNLTEGKL